MSVTEFQRHQIFQWLEGAMGPEKAAIMMDLLPPVGWGDLATKADLGALRTELKGELARLEGKIDRMDGKIDGVDARLDGKIDRMEGRMEHGFARLQRQIYLTTVASNVTVVSLVLALLR